MRASSYAFSANEARRKADLAKHRALGGWVKKPDGMRTPLEGEVTANGAFWALATLVPPPR